MHRGSACALVLLLASTSLRVLHAQKAESSRDTTTANDSFRPRTQTTLDGNWIDRLPVDRIEDALGFESGVTFTQFGGLSLRSGGPEGFNRFLDGFSIRPGYQGGGTISSPAIEPELGTNAVARLDLVTGPLPARLGNAQSGVVLLETRQGGSAFAANARAATDALFGDRNGPGFNRFEGSAGGSMGTRFRLFGALVLQGSASTDPGRGADAIPVFLPAGVDTTVKVPSAINDPLADTTLVAVSRFAVARGRCEAFAGSVNQDIADNYGEECHGVQTPVTNSATYALAARIDYTFSSRSRLTVTGLAGQEQQRFFSYPDLFNPDGLSAGRGWSRVVSAAWIQEFGTTRPIAIRIGLSIQRDRTITGFLTPESERSSRSSFASLLLSPLDFRFDFSSFPLDETLVRNYRDNIPGSRRSPYDLENPDQYTTIDRYRNSPYGTGQFIDSGGPVGRITLERENRTIGSAGLAWEWASHNTLNAGVQVTKYSIGSYSHLLTSSIASDVWIENPGAQGLYLQNTLRLGPGIVVAGVRYDHFATNASRPFVLDTIASSPTFDTYHYFPTPNSYGGGGVTFNGQPLTKFIKDEG
ncbi:MAG: Plug domain-containing protein, partial [Gemmatimonadota bacterium]